jgi:hypothetical protein
MMTIHHTRLFGRIAVIALSVAMAGPAMAAGSIAADSGREAAFARPAPNAPQPMVSGWTRDDRTAATDALNLLEAKGYTVFSHFNRDGSAFTATVEAGGRRYDVRIDPVDRTVTPLG